MSKAQGIVAAGAGAASLIVGGMSLTNHFQGASGLIVGGCIAAAGAVSYTHNKLLHFALGAALAFGGVATIAAGGANNIGASLPDGQGANASQNTSANNGMPAANGQQQQPASSLNNANPFSTLGPVVPPQR